MLQPFGPTFSPSPTNISTPTSTPRWHASSPTRGTYDLLSSCVLTIALCAWTALHLNVPAHGEAGRQWVRKTKWLVLGLLAPEVVVYVAWRQRREAGRVVRRVNGRRASGEKGKGKEGWWGRAGRWMACRRKGIQSGGGDGDDGGKGGEIDAVSPMTSTVSVDSGLERPVWGLVHGFYAVMGGFALDCSDADERFLPGGRTRAALTAEGVRFLLEHEPDLVPDISKEQIKDKSKADGLKKFLVCLQALWFVANCVARVASGLPICLLELNAMGHAACALGIYAMWWEKPLDVDEPTLVRGWKGWGLLAYMWMGSRVGAEGARGYEVHGSLRDEFDAMWMYKYPRFSDLCFDGPEVLGLGDDVRRENDEDTKVLADCMGKSLPPLIAPDASGFDEGEYPMSSRHYKSGSTIGLRFRIVNWLRSKTWLSILGIRLPAGLGVRKTAIDHVSPSDISRWKLAYETIGKYHLEDDVRFRHYHRSEVYDEDSRVKVRIGNLLSLIGSRPYEVWFGFAVAGVLYGGLHMLAWNAPFSSRLEQIFWRISASSVTITPLLLAPFAMLFDKKALGQGGADLTKILTGQDVKRKGGKVKFWLRIASVVIFIPLFVAGPLLWFSYVLGRIYLVVECFKNVAYLPQGVFENVSWPRYVPHIN